MTLICVCVILNLKRHACVISSVQNNFLYDYLLTCKHEEEQANGGWLIHVSFDVICVYVNLHLKRHACVIISMQYNFLYDLPTHLQSFKNKPTGPG
jgi:hypothetical protein